MTIAREQIAKAKALGYEVAIKEGEATYWQGYRGEWIEADEMWDYPADHFDNEEVKELAYLTEEKVVVIIL